MPVLGASVTVEAALALPMFFFAALCLIYMLEIMAIQTNIRAAAGSAAKEASEEMYLVPVINPWGVESDIVSAVGAGRLGQSIVVDGAGGISCLGSYAQAETGEIHMVVTYKVKLPFPQFAVSPIKCKEEFKIKGWTGYKKNRFGNEDDEIVYITDFASVYHRNPECTHLKLSVHMVGASSLSGLRNDYGSKYHACEFCGNGAAAGAVYITNEGDRYHTKIGCSGLKRTVYAVPLSEVRGKGACSRCG